MRKVKIDGQTIEYDFELHYGVNDICPFKPGDKVDSPIIDGLGNTIHFLGVGYVIALSYNCGCVVYIIQNYQKGVINGQ